MSYNLGSNHAHISNRPRVAHSSILKFRTQLLNYTPLSPITINNERTRIAIIQI